MRSESSEGVSQRYWAEEILLAKVGKEEAKSGGVGERSLPSDILLWTRDQMRVKVDVKRD